MTQISALLVGGPTLHLTYAGLSFLTDPTFDEPGDYPGPITLYKFTGPAVPASAPGAIDVVLLSHDQHDDNLDHAGRELLPVVPLVLGTADSATRIPQVTGLAPWQQHRIGAVTITAVPALHGPEGAEALSGAVTGFVLEAEGESTVYVSGDNASVDVVREIAGRFPRIDVAVLFAGAANVGRFGDADLTLNARTALEAAEVLSDAVIVPVHAEGWFHFSETRERLIGMFAYAGRSDRLRVLTAGERTTIG
ncbi:MBL fold metallo-hydrolase [Microbacterium sp. W4I20]|uniref:MBL fold metallo-hydrolase n=1 Tax=Microbacterium sp. W4I20 TaxID=3042262 RepID=UPI0027854DE6|nr:MBL fold metallo-hydrolase [Microbacterium sp. W4I20]MDQ0726328.1 L-ascorbate metabolism protein UlaG (beta-lactamase superfamily) [Microbacterium sp. W4I20]